MKWRFAGIFLVSFAILMGLAAAINFPHLYRGAVLATVQVVSPVVNGWWLDYDLPGFVDPVVFRHGDSQLPMLLQLPTLSVGMMPLISLVVATPGLGAKRIILTSVVGAILYFLLDVAVVLAYPLIMDRPNMVKDTLGVFTGLIAFAVAPLGLWFALTYSTLRSLWDLSPDRRR